MSDDPLALSASASDDRRRPVPSFPNAVVDEPRGRPPDAAAERLDGRAAASGDRAAETVEIGAARATGNPPRRPVRNPYLKSNSSNNRSRPTANNSRPTNVTRPSSSIARSTTNNARSASANNNTGQDASQASTTGANQTPAASARVYSDRWPKHASNFFKRVSDEIDAARKYKYHPKGSTFRGKWPRAYWSGIVKPWEDPLAFVGMNPPPTMNDFCLPTLLVWYPEAQHQDLYPGALPNCKWHGDCKCVVREGWNVPRHGYLEKQVTAILGRWYECRIRRDAKPQAIKPFSFSGVDPGVIQQSHDYVKINTVS